MRRGIVPILQRQRAAPSGTLLYFNFRTREYSDLQFGSAVAGARARGSLSYVGTGEPRQSGEGLLSEKQITNKQTVANFNPVGTTGTSPTAEFTLWKDEPIDTLPTDAAEGLNTINIDGKVQRVFHGITNAAGTVTFAGAVGNTNTHTASSWLWVVSGTVRTTYPGIAGTAATVGQWERNANTQTPSSAANGMQIATTGPAEFFVFGMQSEEKDTRSSLIEVPGGSTVVRPGDDVFTQCPTTLDPQAFTVVHTFRKFANPLGVPDRVIFFDGVPTLQDQIVNGTNISRLTDGTVFIGGPTYTLGDIRTRAFGADGTTLNAGTNGTFDGSATWVPPSGYTNIHFGADPAVVNQVDGYIEEIAIYDFPATQANVEFYSQAGPGFDSGYSGGFN